MTTRQLREALVNGELQTPRITWYDDACGERIELSGRTLGNWVAKAANWLTLDAGLAPGDRLALTVPPTHWRAVYWSLAGWSQGLQVLLGPTTAADADAVVTLDHDPGADTADLVEPAASLAASPLQAMPDAMPPAGAGELPDLGIGEVPPGARVLIEGAGTAVLGQVARVLLAGGSVVLQHRPDPAARADRVRTEGVTAFL